MHPLDSFESVLAAIVFPRTCAIFAMMRAYRNPVYENFFADPFVWKHEGVYYAVGTGPVAPVKSAEEKDFTSRPIGGDHYAIPLLRSGNLVDWQFVGGAVRVPRELRGGAFWAPEVAYDGSNFYLYYSASVFELNHQLRVAVSARPEGPYDDAGLLTPNADQCPFAIDAHPFRDDDGQWFLFYAADYLDVANGVRAGTALTVDRLMAMTRLKGEPRAVLRARHDWQRFKAKRLMYGREFDWHTLEGPCLRKRDGRYYCFYSGGCYENDSYGVDYGVAENVLGPYSSPGAENGPRVLKTVPNRVIGPGHQSIVCGPDDQTEFFVYHAWDAGMTARRMCIDPLIWTSNGPRCAGPTWLEQALC
jgi:beta-xylosidase